MFRKEDTAILISIAAAFMAGIVSAAAAWRMEADIFILLLVLTAIGGICALYVFIRYKRFSSNRSELGENALNERVEELSLFMKYRDHQLLKEESYSELRSRLTKRATVVLTASTFISLFIYVTGLFGTYKIYTANEDFSILIGSGILSIIIAPVLIAGGFIQRKRIYGLAHLLSKAEES